MIIKQKRVQKLEPYFGFLKYSANLVFGVRVSRISKDILAQIGFTDCASGECILPAPIGPVSTYNSNGKYLIHKDKPMETVYRMAEWTWEAWRGRYDTETMSKIVEIPYKRYPRTFVPPPSLELIVSHTPDGAKLIVTSQFKYEATNQESIIHAINLLLEIFGECEVFSENLDGIIKVPIHRLNWKVLPPGKRPWTQLKKDLDDVIQRAPQGNKKVIEYRFEVVNKYKPEFVAIGQAGFSGYVIFGFPQKNLFILESIDVGNATYVFGDDWEELSKSTKAEILAEDRQKDRVIHRENWEKKITKIVS